MRDEIPRSGQDLHPLRRRRGRCGVVPAREVHRVRRSRRRRRRPRRRRLGRGRRRPQHADRLPVPAAFQGRHRHARDGPQPHRPGRRRRGPEGAGRHADPGRGRRDARRRPDRNRPARAPGARRQRRLRQPALHHLHQPRSAARQSRPGRRGEVDLAALEADRRCRPRRAAECRQIHLPGHGHRGQTEDRRLSVHDLASGPRRGADRRARVRARRHPGPDRGRA